MNNRDRELAILRVAARHYRDGDLAAATSACQTLLHEIPDQADALGLLGVIAGRQGDGIQSRKLLQRAVELRPENPEFATNLGLACQTSGDLAAADRYLKRCLNRHPGFAPAWYALAVTRRRLNDMDGAIACYERLLTIDDGHADGWANLAELRERLNQLESAANAAARAVAISPENIMGQLVAAQVAARRGDHEAARQRLEALLVTGRLSTTNETIVRGRLGDALDRLDRPLEAFEQYTSANSIQAQTMKPADEDGTGPYSMATVGRIHRALGALAGSAPDAGSTESPGPVFLLGFPRSGTTLLDRMLCAHPDVESVEEKETLTDAHRDFILPDDGLARLQKLSDSDRAIYGAAYRRRLADSAPSPARIVVDKLPLHTVFLPLIANLMPEARIIFAVRDPRDVCLSCFMQRFTLNAAMAHFLDIDTTARYYRAVMDLGLDSLDQLPVRAHMIRYEELVSAPEPQLRRLLKFLDLEWRAEVLHYHSDIAGRHIDTPSYRQVSQPLYRSSIGRWRRYAEPLAPILGMLEPLARRLGYD